MEIMSKDLSTCVNEYELAYFRKEKEKILKRLDNPPAFVQSKAPLQLENPSVHDQSLSLSQLGDTENCQSSLWGNSESQESREEDKEVDEEDIKRDENIHGACDETDLNSSIEPSFFCNPIGFFLFLLLLVFLFFISFQSLFSLCFTFFCCCFVASNADKKKMTDS
jgi:hypothetical protein